MWHVFRETNQCADTLAKISLNLSSSFVTFVDPPSVVEDLLAFDKAQLYCTCMIVLNIILLSLLPKKEAIL